MKKILYSILISLAIIFCILLYARFVGILGLQTNEIVYTSENLSNSYDGLKVVHFSDLHYKKIITNDGVKNLIKEINKNKPDIVLFTGDLLDSDYEIIGKDISFLIKELSKINATYGKYAVIGDSDYSKSDTVKNIYIQSEFTLLDNSYSVVHNENNDLIFIGGVSSYTYDEANIDNVMGYFNSNVDIPFKIIMVHEPDYADKILEKYHNISLILSGHSIGGSVNVPGINKLLAPNGAKKYYKDYYLVNNTSIFISNGVGCNDVNFRLFNHPSINFYRISRNND